MVPLCILLLALVFLLLLPQMNLLEGVQRKALTALLSFVGLAGLIVGSLTAGFNEDNKQPTHMMYAVDADTGEAWWLSFENRPSDWTQQFLGAEPESKTLGNFALLDNDWLQPKVKHALVGLPELPVVELVEDQPLESGRRLSLRLNCECSRLMLALGR